MISVLVSAFPTSAGKAATPADVVRSLSALVPAVVEGLARDVCLLAPAPNDEFSLVADHAGCALIGVKGFAAAVAAGADQCRCPHVLVIEAGVMVDRPFLDELTNLLPRLALADPTRRYALKDSQAGIIGRLFPSQGRTVGILTSRERLLASRGQRFADLIRAARPLKTMKSRAWTGS